MRCAPAPRKPLAAGSGARTRRSRAGVIRRLRAARCDTADWCGRRLAGAAGRCPARRGPVRAVRSKGLDMSLDGPARPARPATAAPSAATARPVRPVRGVRSARQASPHPVPFRRVANPAPRPGAAAPSTAPRCGCAAPNAGGPGRRESGSAAEGPRPAGARTLVSRAREGSKADARSAAHAGHSRKSVAGRRRGSPARIAGALRTRALATAALAPAAGGTAYRAGRPWPDDTACAAAAPPRARCRRTLARPAAGGGRSGAPGSKRARLRPGSARIAPGLPDTVPGEGAAP